jgi:hypothetical protein
VQMTAREIRKRFYALSDAEVVAEWAERERLRKDVGRLHGIVESGINTMPECNWVAMARAALEAQ